MLKKCCHCKKEKSIDEFRVKDKKTGLLDYRCKICKKKYTDEYYEKNKQKILDYSKKYSRDNSPEAYEKKREYQRNYYQENKDRFRDYAIYYYRENREQVKAYSRKFYAKYGRKKPTEMPTEQL